jgi:Domain of unknown function (DUF5666)
MNTFLRTLIAGLSVCALATTAAVNAQSLKFNAQVVAFDASTLQVRGKDGAVVAVKVGDNTRFSGRSPASLDRITQGSFIGTTATPLPDGTLTASEVHIFPESMRGTGEGHRPMDAATGSTMTNATVRSIGGGPPPQMNTMTNATVAKLGAGDGVRKLSLSYAGGEKVVVVPAGTPIVMVEPADRSMLVPGAQVLVYATRQADGSLSADRVSIGKNGFVPPI